MNETAPNPRTPSHPIEPLFFARWSPRAFTGEELPESTLMGLFEAARWAPSAMNAQPWRFVYARRGTPAFDKFLATLAPANQAWAKRASALVAVVSSKVMNDRARNDPAPLPSHSFDAGAAWAQLALQAHLWGLGTHAMGGFDREKARQALLVPDAYQIEVFVAVGRQGDPSSLPDWAKAREKPNERRPLEDLVREGSFAF
ncbi:MAG TPA: nitroreductase family protein [Anaeromyxobacteraceae bacterium]|nr:nitroreductase family protein [Anaeromyxobacteraceae bacterium]